MISTIVDWLKPGGMRSPMPITFEEGYDACMQGKHENPFKKGTREYEAWDDGQKDAFNEQAMYW
ncbi:hypothetical protein B0G84_4965 [Paraburkholderia sp. BL8N3]|nr:hypothetical protein [Paraburkholderia sp. BL8N3]TCK39625.1 hypothetical protein B0G84_4965 [Paraburkholderia sp. BL8N3]